VVLPIGHKKWAGNCPLCSAANECRPVCALTCSLAVICTVKNKNDYSLCLNVLVYPAVLMLRGNWR